MRALRQTAALLLAAALMAPAAAHAAEVTTVHVLDHDRRPVADLEVELVVERPAGQQRLAAQTDATGRATFPDLTLDCTSLRLVAGVGDQRVSSRPRSCDAPPDIHLVLPPSPGEAAELEAPTDLDGNPLLALPPGIDDGRVFRDREHTRRFVEPGMFELGLRLGLDLCVTWLGSPEASCVSGQRAGASVVASMTVHLIDAPRWSLNLGLEGGYRFSRAAFERQDSIRDQEHHLATIGPLLVLMGDADDWIFGLDIAPLGFTFRSSRLDHQGAPTARTELGRVDGTTRFGLFGAWRGWGHLPLGLYFELFQPLGLGSVRPLPPGTFTLGAFIGRRVGPGRGIWTR